MKQLKVGVVGAGVIAIDVHVKILFADAPEKFKVVAIADPDRAAAERGAAAVPNDVRLYASHHEMLAKDDEVELVLVAVPPYHTAPTAIDCLAAGRHVMCEKPMGNTAADALHLLEASRQAEGRLMIAEQFFFIPGYRKLAEIARTGDWPFSPPLLVRLHQFWRMTPKSIPQFYHSPWRHDKRLTHGYLIEGGCHTANPLREAFGMVEPHGAMLLSADPDLGAHDTLIAHGRFESGPAFQITCSYGLRSHSRQEIELLSPDGSVLVEGGHLLLTDLDRKQTRIETPYPTDHRKPEYRAEWEHFYDVLVNGAEQQFTAEQAYHDILFMQRLIDAAAAPVA